MKSKYDTNNHSVFLLQYHLILVVKYRKKVMTDEISERLKEIFEYIAKKDQYQLQVVEFNHDQDHLHILFKAQPKSEISKFIGTYKSASSRLIKKDFPQIREKLWKEMFWSQSFFLSTVGTGVNIETLKKYVESQGVEREKAGNPNFGKKR
jgi:putative transposase